MTRTILSVCDEELRAVRPYSLNGVDAFNTTYILTANAKGQHSTCKVTDAFDRFQIGENDYRPVPEAADGIANDIIGQWTKNTVVPPPGVILCAGDEPTQEEIERAHAIQQIHCEYLRNKASELWATDHKQEATSPQYRRASIYLGYTSDPWLMPEKPQQTETCPWCGQQVPAGVANCFHCGKIVNFTRAAQLEAMQQAAFDQAKAAIAPHPVPQIPVPSKPQARA